MSVSRASEIRGAVGNFLITAIIFTLIFILPVYLGMVISLSLMGYEEMGFLNWLLQPIDTLYMFYQLFQYWSATDNYSIPYFEYKFLIPSIAGFTAGGFFLFIFRAPLMDFRPFKKKESLHGEAKWGTLRDAKKIGLCKKKGVLLGKKGRGSDYYIIDDFQHVLLFAPTGSGKGVGFVIPNLLFWEESIIVHDIKLENYELTSGYRAKLGQDVFLWNPADPDGYTHCYNPLDWISSKPGQMVDDAQKICSLIIEEQEFWENEARSLLLGIILYLCAVPDKPTSFGEVVRTLRSDDVVYNLAVVLDTLGGKIHQVAYMNIAAFLQKADKERSGCISTANSKIELWANPLIDTATASSDFNLQTLKRRKQSIFVGVSPDNLNRLQPLLKVFYQQATDFLTRKIPDKDEPHGVMIMMDEFPSLGKMEQFKIGIAYFRGYRVKLFLIVQDTEQLKDIYEEAGMNAFLSNSYYRVTYSANNYETANMISQLVGNKTVDQTSHNKPKFLDLNPASRTLNVSETSRALLLPQEVIQLPRDEQIILIESSPPFKCKKIMYYKDNFFKKRLLPKTFVPTQEPYDPRKLEKKLEEKEQEKQKIENQQQQPAPNKIENKEEAQAIPEPKPQPSPAPAQPKPEPQTATPTQSKEPAPQPKKEEPKPQATSSAPLPVSLPEEEEEENNNSPFDTPIPAPKASNSKDFEADDEDLAEFNSEDEFNGEDNIEDFDEDFEERKKEEEELEKAAEEARIQQEIKEAEEKKQQELQNSFDAPLPPPPPKKKKK